MAWNTKRWVKVPVYEKPEFWLLPLSTRGLYRLITPHLGPDGRVYVGKDPVVGLALILHATPDEVRSHLSKLVDSNFVAVENGDTIFDPFFLQSSPADKSSPSKLGDVEVEVEVEVDKKKKKPGRPPSDPRHQPVIDLFHDLWREIRCGKYVVQGRDVRAVSDLLKRVPGATLDEFGRRIRAALNTDWFRQGKGSLQFFCNNWSNYENVTAIGRPSKPKSARDYWDEMRGCWILKDGTMDPTDTTPPAEAQ